MDKSTLIWFLPIGLLVLIIIRLFIKREKETIPAIAKKNPATLTLLALIAIPIIFAVGLVINKFDLFSHSVKCPTALSPQEIAGLIGKDSSEIVGFFYSKNFTVERIEWMEKKISCWAYRAILTHKHKEIEVVDERGYIDNANPGAIFYELTSRDKYSEFIQYLKSIGADSFRQEQTNITNRDKGYFRYKNSFILDKGFIIQDTAYQLAFWDTTGILLH